MNRLIAFAIVFLPLAAVVSAASVVNYCLGDQGGLKFWISNSVVAQNFPAFYADNLRASLFAGFLTLGGFLMSLKAFIVVNMKKEVFESDAYKRVWDEARSAGTAPYSKKFQPLRELSTTIFIAVISCIGSAVAQLTVGLIPSFYASAFAIALAASAIGFVLRTLWLIRNNLQVLFDYLDETDG